MGITATAAAMKNKLKINAEWRANRRTTSDAFLKVEQESRDRYNEFTKLSREFSKTYPNEFKNFVMAKADGRPVAPRPFGTPRHMPAITAPHMPAPTFAPIPVLPDSTDRQSLPRRIPTAQEMENSRPKPAADMLSLLGLRLD
jgi:hypothetical protein